MKIDFPIPTQYDQLRKLWQDAFGDDEIFVDGFFCTGFAPARCRCVMENDKILAALHWLEVTYKKQRFAHIYAVATAKEMQGRGIGRALLEDTHAHLKLRGYDGALLYPQNEALRDFYRSLGYADCTTVSRFTCEAAADAVSLHRIDRDTYAALRREYLPEGGALQEEENIAYLEMMAFFYAGEDFLLAAHTEGQTLDAPELLGNTNAAPGILAALNCQSGTFSVPGPEIPFAMGLPLVKDAKMPTYLGFAFI